MSLATPSSIRKLNTGRELPRLAPIEEIDSTTDLTSFARQVPMMSLPDGGAEPSPLTLARNAADLLVSRCARMRLVTLGLVFVAGCVLGGLAILLMR